MPCHVYKDGILQGATVSGSKCSDIIREGNFLSLLLDGDSVVA